MERKKKGFWHSWCPWQIHVPLVPVSKMLGCVHCFLDNRMGSNHSECLSLSPWGMTIPSYQYNGNIKFWIHTNFNLSPLIQINSKPTRLWIAELWTHTSPLWDTANVLLPAKRKPDSLPWPCLRESSSSPSGLFRLQSNNWEHITLPPFLSFFSPSLLSSFPPLDCLHFSFHSSFPYQLWITLPFCDIIDQDLTQTQNAISFLLIQFFTLRIKKK